MSRQNSRKSTKIHKCSSAHPARKLSGKNLAAGTAAAAAMYLGSGSADHCYGDLVHFDSSNMFSVTDNDSINWDVDGLGTTDFTLRGRNDPGTSPGLRNVVLSSGADGKGWVRLLTQTSSNIQALPAGFTIGPTLGSGYAFGIFATDHFATLDGAFLQVNGFSDGEDGLAGFRFEISGNKHYGWARLNITLGTTGVENGELKVVEWAYESTPDTAIAAGAVAIPEANQVTVFSGLALLACGAAGVKHWRREKEGLTDV